MSDGAYDSQVRFLDPQRVRVSRDAFGKLEMEAEGDTYAAVTLARAFPLSTPDQFISFADSDGKEIGLVEDLSALDRASRAAVEEELALLYFSPVVTRILKVDQNYGATTWHLETDRGPRLVRVKDRGDIRALPPRKVVMNDVHGLRYQIPDTDALDETSRLLLERES